MNPFPLECFSEGHSGSAAEEFLPQSFGLTFSLGWKLSAEFHREGEVTASSWRERERESVI